MWHDAQAARLGAAHREVLVRCDGSGGHVGLLHGLETVGAGLLGLDHRAAQVEVDLRFGRIVVQTWRCRISE